VVQFTSAGWIGLLTEHRIAFSMDGRGRVFDNIFVERFWRTRWAFYNHTRPHSSLKNVPPAAVYWIFHKLSDIQHLNTLSLPAPISEPT
jgi:transposase InsO family protein